MPAVPCRSLYGAFFAANLFMTGTTRLLHTDPLFGRKLCWCEVQVKVAAGEYGVRFGRTRVRAILRVSSKKN